MKHFGNLTDTMGEGIFGFKGIQPSLQQFPLFLSSILIWVRIWLWYDRKVARGWVGGWQHLIWRNFCGFLETFVINTYNRKAFLHTTLAAKKMFLPHVVFGELFEQVTWNVVYYLIFGEWFWNFTFWLILLQPKKVEIFLTTRFPSAVHSLNSCLNLTQPTTSPPLGYHRPVPQK